MSHDLELLGARTGNCLRVAIALEESALTHRITRVAVEHGEHRSEAFRKMNPAEQVPVLIDHGFAEEPFVLTQSNAIMMHIAEKAPGLLLPEHDARQRSRGRERFFYFLTDVIGPNAGAFQLRRSGLHNEVSPLDTLAMKKIHDAERFLETSAFIGGDTFTLADIAALTITKYYKSHIDWPSVPMLERWYESVLARPAVQRGLSAFS